jgi:hypothetical protein
MPWSPRPSFFGTIYRRLLIKDQLEEASGASRGHDRYEASTVFAWLLAHDRGIGGSGRKIVSADFQRGKGLGPVTLRTDWRYHMPMTSKTVLSHAEIQTNLG